MLAMNVAFFASLEEYKIPTQDILGVWHVLAYISGTPAL